MEEDDSRMQLLDRHPNVDFYINHLGDDHRSSIHFLREKIHEWVPGVLESMQYRIPTFVTSSMLCAVGSQRRHMALYVCVTDVLNAHRDQLEGLNVGRACIRFSHVDDLPLHTIERIILQSADVIDAHNG